MNDTPENAAPLYSSENLYSRQYVRDLLELHNIRLHKRQGQNFLVERHSIDQVMRHAGVTSDDVVLEIGAGIGHLTTRLVETARHVITIEIDERFLPIIKGMCGDRDNLTLVQGDIMKVDLGARCAELGWIPTKVVANIPYYITTPIVEKLYESDLPLENITLTIQDEVARRYTAEPGTKQYSSISVVLRYWGDPVYCAPVPARSFFPRPQVDSAVVRVDFHDTPPVGVANENLLYHVVRTAFQQRRKMLHNALSSLENEGYAVEQALDRAGIDSSRRPAMLSLEEYARLTDILITTSALPTMDKK